MDMQATPHIRSELHPRETCPVCGSHELSIDQVHDGRVRLVLGECPRCDHRFTRSPSRPLRAASARLHPDQALPTAA